MFDVGFTEILLIGIVALIVIGPERLPAVAKTVGQWVGKVQRFVRGVKTDLASELETGDLKKLIGDQREQINELRTMVSTAAKDLKSTTDEAVQSAKSGLTDLEQSVSDAKSEVASQAESDKPSIDDDYGEDYDLDHHADNDGSFEDDYTPAVLDSQKAESKAAASDSSAGNTSSEAAEQINENSANSVDNRTGTTGS